MSTATHDTGGAPPANSLAKDAQKSMKMASKLGLSLIGTWAVALLVRIALPRFLGPVEFGDYQFADAFTTTIFVFATLGLDTYIRKEVAVRFEHASEFFGGTLALSIALSVLIMLVALVGLQIAGRPSDVLTLVAILGVAQMLTNSNALLVAMLHARGTVNELSIMNVGAKLLWGGGIIFALYMDFGIRGAGIAVLTSEVFRMVVLLALASKHLALKMRFDIAASLLALRGSLPFYVAGMAQTIYARIDLSIMAFLAPTHEVGWYGAASTLGGLSLMLSPVIGWVLLPMTARAAARAKEELMLLTRRAIELVLALAFPIAMVLYLAAGELVALAFGAEYAPSATAVRILAPTFILTYAAIVYASILIRVERGWAITMVSLGGMVISPALNLVLIPRMLAAHGDGGAGSAAAITLVVTEAYTVTAFLILLGRQAVDRRLLRMVALTVFASAASIATDGFIQSLGVFRIGVDMLVYFAIVIVTGALDVRSGRSLIDTLRSRTPAAAS